MPLRGQFLRGGSGHSPTLGRARPRCRARIGPPTVSAAICKLCFRVRVRVRPRRKALLGRLARPVFCAQAGWAGSLEPRPGLH